MEYLKRTWIGYDKTMNKKKVHVSPLFPPYLWNCLSHLSQRTSNYAEAFHKIFNASFTKVHPPFDQFAQTIRNFEDKYIHKFNHQFHSIIKDEKIINEVKKLRENEITLNGNKELKMKMEFQIFKIYLNYEVKV